MDLTEFLAVAFLLYLLWSFFQPENGMQGKAAPQKTAAQNLDEVYHQRN